MDVDGKLGRRTVEHGASHRKSRSNRTRNRIRNRKGRRNRRLLDIPFEFVGKIARAGTVAEALRLMLAIHIPRSYIHTIIENCIRSFQRWRF